MHTQTNQYLLFSKRKLKVYMYLGGPCHRSQVSACRFTPLHAHIKAYIHVYITLRGVFTKVLARKGAYLTDKAQRQ